jgi:hypothetical protein
MNVDRVRVVAFRLAHGHLGTRLTAADLTTAAGVALQHTPPGSAVLGLGARADSTIALARTGHDTDPERTEPPPGVKDDPFGVEFAEIAIAEDRLTARGVALGMAPLPYRLDYELETSAGFTTAQLRLTPRCETCHRELDFRR